MRKLTLLLCGVTLAACSHSTTPYALPSAAQTFGTEAAPARPFRVLYRFRGAPQGEGPTGIVAFHGSLFGTTTGGGAYTLGTVYVRTSSGSVNTLYSFHGGTDGSEPSGALVALSNTLYGTTQYGGANGDGTVFAITPSGSERVVYSFKGGGDGATPVLAGLVAVNEKLYGTTNAGGQTKCDQGQVVGCGTVFVLTTSGHERVLHRFKGMPDGANPAGSLIEVGSRLYGTTSSGGAFDNGCVFTISTSGKEKVLYSFKGFPDGAMPYAGLTQLNGRFYGTTTLGGAYQGAGTVYELSSSGSERVLHSFRNAPDGALPYAPLVVSNGVLFGTTEYGGSSRQICAGHGIVGCGTIFSSTTSGTLRVLHKFMRRDGAYPLAGLISSGDGFYGTASGGGGHNNGTLFVETRQ